MNKGRSSTTPLIIGLHVPKCAGLTILRHVQKHLPAEFIYQNTGIHDNFAKDRPEFLTIRAKEKLQFVWGHFIHEEMIKQLGLPTVLFTGLRDPVARVQSEVNYLSRLYKGLGRSFEPADYVQKLKHPMCSFFNGRFPTIAGTEGSVVARALRVLECFHLVYFPETFDAITTKVLDLLSIPAILERENVSTDTGLFDINAQSLAEDVELYQEARLRWGEPEVNPSFDLANSRLAKILSMPQQVDRLRKFLHIHMMNEYMAWGELDAVIAAREGLVEELTLELDFYRKNLLA